MPPPSVGLVGCGRWGEAILRDLLGLGCRVLVADPSGVRRARARELGGTPFESASALPGADGFVVASPTSRHEESILAVASHGSPIFCEKPLTADPAAARRLAGALSSRLFVMDKWRYHPAVEALAGVIGRREIGGVVSLRTARLQPGSDHADVDGIWILAPHDLSIGTELLGPLPAPLRASGTVREGRAVGLRAFFGPSPLFAFDVSTDVFHRRRAILLRGEAGSAAWSDARPGEIEIRRREGPSPRELRTVAGPPPLLRELEVFVGHLRGGPPPKASALDGALSVETISLLRGLAGLP